MEVVLAKTAGFCFGVKRAVDLVYTESEQSHQVYTYGPIIHNEEVVKDLEEKGVQVLETEQDLTKNAPSSVIGFTYQKKGLWYI